MKYNYELLQSLCNIEMLNNDYSGQKINRDTYIEGKCVTEKCQNTFRRTFRNLYERKNLCCDQCSKNNAKIKAKQSGYLYEIWVYDNKGNKINCII